MKKQNIPEEIVALITEEEINIFQELQIKIKELNHKTNLTRLIDGNDYWVSQVFDSIWPFKAFPNINFNNKKFLFLLQLLRQKFLRECLVFSFR